VETNDFPLLFEKKSRINFAINKQDPYFKKPTKLLEGKNFLSRKT
jgi:hypothetical protein